MKQKAATRLTKVNVLPLNPIKKLMYVNEIKSVMSLAQTQIFIPQSQPPSTLMPHAGSIIGAVACNH